MKDTVKFSTNRDTRVIALCMAKFNGLDQISFLKAFNQACERKKYKLFVFSSSIDFLTDFNTEPEEAIFDLMNPARFDAVVIMTNSLRTIRFRTGLPPELMKRELSVCLLMKT